MYSRVFFKWELRKNTYSVNNSRFTVMFLNLHSPIDYCERRYFRAVHIFALYIFSKITFVIAYRANYT